MPTDIGRLCQFKKISKRYAKKAHGGTGFYTVGKGIQEAMNEDSLVATMRAAGIPSSITTYLLSGGSNTIPLIHNEHTGPSDGIVFIASATDTGGIGTVGSVVTISGDNHLELAWESTAVNQGVELVGAIVNSI